jgi:ribosomal protein S18 acetylase RimI-like enzyme
MIEAMQGIRDFTAEEVTEPVGPRDYLILAGIYKQVHPELDMASQSIMDLKDTLNILADPRDGKSGLIIARKLAFDRAVGAAMLHITDEPHAAERGTVIDEIFVEKRSRGRSVGRLLVREAIDFAYRKNSRYVLLGRQPQTQGGRRLFVSLDFMEDEQGLLRLNLNN